MYRQSIIIKFFIVPIFLFFIIFFSKASFALSKKSKSDDIKKAYKKIEIIIDQNMSKYNIPGAIVGVWLYDTKPIIIAKGKANIKKSQIMQTNLKFRIASISKTFVATVILQLVDEGKIYLSEKLERFLPDIPNSRDITIRQLCNHTSGVIDYLDDEKCRRSYEKELLRKWTPYEIIDIVKKHEPYFFPGNGWKYSNTNYIILGIIIEKVTGNKIEEEIKNRILEPLSLSNTYFPSEPFLKSEYSNGYMTDDSTGLLIDVTLVDPSLAWAAGAMVSNIYDLKVWSKVLAKGNLLSDSTQHKRLEFLETESGFKHGLGIIDYYGAYGHDGFTQGYNTCMFYLPCEKATIITLLNLSISDENPARNICFSIADIFFSNE